MNCQCTLNRVYDERTITSKPFTLGWADMSGIDPFRIDGLRRYKAGVFFQGRLVKTGMTLDPVSMLSVALLSVLAAVLSATYALPLYSDTALTPQEDLLQKLVSEVDEGQRDDLSEQRDVKTVFPLLLERERDRDSWPKDMKETLQQTKMNNMVDDLKAAVLKLAAADNLRSQGFLRSEQSLPKPNKRACFWKYCVTN